MPAVTAERDLLFGLLALQNGLIDQGQLVAAFQVWTLDKSRSLADYLVARGDLNPAQRAAIEALAALHIDKHGGDADRTASYAVNAPPPTASTSATPSSTRTAAASSTGTSSRRT